MKKLVIENFFILDFLYKKFPDVSSRLQKWNSYRETSVIEVFEIYFQSFGFLSFNIFEDVNTDVIEFRSLIEILFADFLFWFKLFILVETASFFMINRFS